MINTRIKLILMLLILSHNGKMLYSMEIYQENSGKDQEKERVGSIKRFQNFNQVNDNESSFLLEFRKVVLEESRIEKRKELLHDGLSYIKEKYIQRINDDTDFPISFPDNPNVGIIKTTVFFVSHAIIAKILNKTSHAYPNNDYAKEFYQFLLPIKRHPYISVKDKKKIYKEIHPKVKKLKLSQGKEGVTIRMALLDEKQKCFCF